MYPAATQSFAEDDMPRSSMIVGSAVKTTVLSMVVMNALTATTASAHRYRPRVTLPCGGNFRTVRGNPPLPLNRVVAIVTIGSHLVTQP